MASDIKAVTITNEPCNDLGLGTINAGVTCSFAMECYEKKLLHDWSGIELNRGNSKAQQELIRLMATREGFEEFLPMERQLLRLYETAVSVKSAATVQFQATNSC